MVGLLNMAAQGRNGDTKMAHLTPGEVVIPKEIAALRPDLVAHIGGIVKKMGGDPTSLVVGRGRVNPQTGVEEFATADEVKAAYQAVLGRDPDEAGMQYWTAQNDLGAFRSAAAPELATTGYKGTAAPTRETVNSIYQSTFGRPAEEAGANYWLEQANKFPGADLNTAIKANALGTDVIARNDISAGGVDTGKTWSYGASLDNKNLTYDAANNTWGTFTTPTVTTPTVTTPTVTTPTVTVPTETPSYTPSTVTPSTYTPTDQGAAATWTPAASDPVTTYNAATMGDAKTYTATNQNPATAWNAAVSDPATTFNASTAGVNTVTQDPRYGTVEGRIGGLLSQDNELMQRAAQRGMDLANTRGLLNSGMAVQNAQTAVMDQALPIASADAASFNTIQANNMAAQNRNMEFNASQKQLSDSANALAENARAEANAGRTQEAARLQALSQDAANQFNANAANKAAADNAAAKNQVSQFNATQKQLADSANSLAANARAEANAGRTQEAERLYAAARDAVSQFNANAANQASQYNATARNQTNQFNASAQNAAAAQAVENANQFALQTLRGTQAQALADTEAKYKTTIQSNASAANFYASVVQQWTASQTATGTTAEQKEAAATYFQQALQNGMAIISAGAGDGALDYASLLNFTTTAGAPA